MSDPRQKLFGRFRASALDRLRRTSLVLIELEAGRGGAADLEGLARELHTVKGESRMFGLAPVAEVCHAAEDLVLAGNGKPPPPEACVRLIAALEVVSQALQGEAGIDETVARALRQAAEGLRGTARAAAPASAESGAAATPGAGTPDAAGTAEAAGHTGAGNGAAAAAAAGERWIQVGARKVDDLCEQVAQISSDFRALAARLAATESIAAGAARRALLEDFDRCRTQLDALMSASWALRLQQIEPALGDLVRHARELALQQGKRLRVSIDAAGAQVERSVLDELWEPLLHIVRNAVDHGIEPPDERGQKPPEARLSLRAEPSGASVLITIADDGRGIDPDAVRAAAVRRGLLTREAAAALGEREALELTFQHGFSTRAEVSELSGRGVGLDVVRSVVENLGGTVTLDSRRGEGTTLTLSIPTRLSLERTLVVECGGALYGVPSRQVLEVIPRVAGDIRVVPGGEVLRHREENLPYRSLAALLGSHVDEEPWVLILAAGVRRWAIGCPALVGEFDLLRQPVDRVLAGNQHVGASATLDDGRLVLLLATAGLVRLDARAPGPRPTAPPAKRRRHILVVDDSEIIRDLVAQVLRGAGFEVQTAPDGGAALALIEASPPDAVVADVEMPVMDGFELLRRVRLSWPALPVIMLTTRSSVEDHRRAAQLGANAHLIKSVFQEATLLQTVRRFVDQPA